MADENIKVSHKDEADPNAGELTYEGTYFTPAVDIFETPSEIVLLADMPGVAPGDLDVDLNDDVLTILGKVAPIDDEGIDLLSEYRLGTYYRDFRMTDIVDRSKINATLADGVLTLVLPKAAKAVPRKIPISVG
jgi:HSP20 family protein